MHVLVYARILVHQLLHRLQLHCSRVALHDVPDGLGVSLQAPDQIFVGRRHAAALELRDLHLQAPRLIGQLGNDDVPDSEALVAGFAGRELPPVSPGALVTAEARRPLRARALTGGTVALLAGDSTRVAIASWERQREMMRSRNFRGLKAPPQEIYFYHIVPVFLILRSLLKQPLELWEINSY